MRASTLGLAAVLSLLANVACAQRLALDAPTLRLTQRQSLLSANLNLDLHDRPPLATSALRRPRTEPSAGSRWLTIGGVSAVSMAMGGYFAMSALGGCYDPDETAAHERSIVRTLAVPLVSGIGLLIAAILLRSRRRSSARDQRRIVAGTLGFSAISGTLGAAGVLLASVGCISS